MKLFFILVFFMIIMGCEKAVSFKLEQSSPKLVVEATIENGQAPVVYLSSSVNYFSKITPQILAESFIHGATVKISNGVTTHILKEYTVPVSSIYNFYYYSVDSSNLASAFTGALNTGYTLQITHNGIEYSSSTRIPGFNKRIDSIWWKTRPGDTSEVSIIVRATDPFGFGNYIRYWTKTNREPFFPGFASVYDDLVIDGTTYELEVEPGINRNGSLDMDEHVFRKGDTVTLKLSGIDKATYDFWRTMEYTYASVGNPFSSPIKVTTNISNGALGYFGGYASQYKTMIIPR